MKKILLFAALAAASLSMSAQYTIEKLWGTENVPAAADCRQGVGLNGKFYINDKTDNGEGQGSVLVYGENGLENQLFPGGLNCGINIDQAGHVIVSLATFPNAGSWLFDDETPMIRVIDPATGEVTDLPLGGGAPNGGRLDVLGRAYGNLLESGELYLPLLPANGGINRYFYEGGEVLGEDCYAPLQSPAANADNMTIINAVVDADGNDAIFYYQRGGMPYLYYWNGDNLEGEAINIPACDDGTIRCNQNGADFFAYNGKNFVVYPCGAANNAYYDGFAIYEIGAEVPFFWKSPTISAAANGFQANWLNAEVTEDGVLIYQYAPGKSMEVYKMSLPAEETPDVYILGEVNENSWAPNVGLKMTQGDGGQTYFADITCDGRNDGYNYFSFTTELAENNDQGGWDYIAPYRFGAVSDGDFLVTDEMIGIELALTYEGGQAYKIPAGNYTLMLDLTNMKLVINKVVETRTISGNVYDAEGNPLEGVTVTAMPLATEPEVMAMRAPGEGYTTTTDADGHYDLEVPADGEYSVTFEKEGYLNVTVPEIEAETVTLEADPNTAVSDVNAAKAVASVKYVNAAGQVSANAFNGVNIMVTTYTDGSKSAVKVVK
ncbi:MAG: carboxypeptidase regulatory-like domain-containing protein [Muribaculaceae bacterium]|nr:carboxypeptidase regulatory-like domain-containing protein [Muribaculaceae bacterium]